MIELPVVPSNQPASPRTRFWRSIEHLESDPSYSSLTAAELMPGAQGRPEGSTRRRFLEIMGSSMALAGLTACRKPVEAIMPFARKPEDLIPGVPLNYASGMEFMGALRPMLVEATDGRPTKIEGNPEHPESTGASGVFEQAALLSLYDPDRSDRVLREGNESDWAEFVRFAAERHARAGTGRLVVLSRPTTSPTVSRLAADIAATYPGSRWITYDHGLQASTSVRTRYHFDRADTVFSLGADFLGSADPDQLHSTATFARGRQVDDGARMSRLYQVESAYTITGGMADHRLALKPSQIAPFGAAVARRLGVDVPGTSFDDHPWVAAIADDLRDSGASAVVVAPVGSPAVKDLADAMNDALGAVGTTVVHHDAGPLAVTAGLPALRSLAAEMQAGSVDTVLMLDVNPVYELAGTVDFGPALGRVAQSIHVGQYVDETARASRWHLPSTHFLEAWGDGRAYGGTMSVSQPLIAPLYDEAHSVIEIVSLLASGIDQPGHDVVRETWQGRLPDPFEAAWRRVVHDGFHPDSAYDTIADEAAAAQNRRSRLAAAAMAGIFDDRSRDGLEVVITPDSAVFDGAFSNNAWLQELPDAVTKVVWDNVAAMSPATAEGLGVGTELVNGQHFADRITLTAGDGSIDLPVWIVPGMAESVVHVTLGYGRDISSRRAERHTNLFDLDDQTDVYGKGAISSGVGVNVAPIRSQAGLAITSGITAAKSGDGYLVASTQDHGAMPDEGAEAMGRGLYRMATVDAYRENPEFVREGDPKAIREEWADYPALWQQNHPADQPGAKDNPYYPNQWGMVIDLNTCTGCSACTIACQAENNIQVVGKDEVSRGREMHWIRMDRYFVGDGSDGSPMMVSQPVPCMHCENAPCESVCPVAATVHSPDGTNQMIYNRCIGTRYCANNCPYKVRRFNYYAWSKTLPESLHMAQNPNVTVRSRGVMEKCSYCIQRVREVNKRSNVENRPIRDGEVVTACQQACPANAIVFGDLAEPESAVVHAKRNKRRYELLAELSVKPRTSYLGRIRNPNPRIEAGA